MSLLLFFLPFTLVTLFSLHSFFLLPPFFLISKRSIWRPRVKINSFLFLLPFLLVIRSLLHRLFPFSLFICLLSFEQLCNHGLSITIVVFLDLKFRIWKEVTIKTDR